MHVFGLIRHVEKKFYGIVVCKNISKYKIDNVKTYNYYFRVVTN